MIRKQGVSNTAICTKHRNLTAWVEWTAEEFKLPALLFIIGWYKN
jgi:hypothetical protein